MNEPIKISQIIAEALKRQGDNKSEIERKTGFSSQLLGQYASGKKEPKLPFYMKWKEVFGEDLLREIETKVYLIAPTEEARPQGQAPTIDERVDQIEASLGKVLKNQDGSLAFLWELLQRDARREAKGNEEKGKKILNEILHKLSPELNLHLKTGIFAHDGNTDMENP